MKNIKLIKYKDIGAVYYRKNSRAKNLAIRINNEGQVKVTIPRWCSLHRAEKFVVEKNDWIKQKLAQIERKKANFLVWKPGEDQKMMHKSIFIEQPAGINFNVQTEGKKIRIIPPQNYTPDNIEDQGMMMEIMASIGNQEAKLELPVILQTLSQHYQLPYNRVTVRRMKTRWGSCSGNNNISLNSGLIFLPRELVVYVCLHELVHTIHKNHSKLFWNALATILPDCQVRRKELRKVPIIA